MKRIGLTQRVEVLSGRNERRDCLDQSWAQLLLGLDMLPLPLLNKVENTESYLKELDLDGLILTGGNDLDILDEGNNKAPERDRFERLLINFFCSLNLPVLGVCRGMQLIAVHYGSKLNSLDGHVTSRHKVTLDASTFKAWPESMDVNSYHQFGVENLSLNSSLKAIAWAEDGSIEALVHKELPVYGIMWHPEREHPWAETDLNMMRHIFGEEQ